jgi:hypothetical protein
MQIKNEKPPFLGAILESGMTPSEKTLYTHGSTIFNPSGMEIPDHLIVHEETHSKQQGDAPGAWWERYLHDQFFRVQQECEAYANQYRFLCTIQKDRNRRARILWDLGGFLSSPMYGSVIGHQEAMQMIKKKANVT